MSKIQVRVGSRFSRLTVIAPAEHPRFWMCRCECGTEKAIRQEYLTRGTTKSCGCLHAEHKSTGSPTHGHTKRDQKHPLYQIWSGMRQRCQNPNSPSYERYGGRGIKVCDEWEDFVTFITDVGERPPNPEGWLSQRSYWSLDRIDNDGNYEPGNVRWATPSEQRNNQRKKKASDPMGNHSPSSVLEQETHRQGMQRGLPSEQE